MLVLYAKPNQKGYGLSISKSSTGPHYVSEVVEFSSASDAGLRQGDLLLKVNGINLVGKSYRKTVEILKKEALSKESFQLEVVQSDLCPKGIKNKAISENNLDNDELYGNFNA